MKGVVGMRMPWLKSMHFRADPGTKPKLNDKELDDLLKKLGGAGKGFKVFKPEDFAGLNDEQMKKKFGKDEM